MAHNPAATHHGGHAPLVFEPGWCFRCGRLLASAVEFGVNVDWWIPLEAAIEGERMALVDEARGAGVDVEDPAAYRAWLEGVFSELPAAPAVLGPTGST